MVVKLYVSETSGNVMMKGQQDHIRRIFDTKNIEYKEIDIAAPQCVDDKKFMQEVVRRSNPEIQALPPQLFQDETYRGDYESFFHAIETESVYKYLGLTAPAHEVEYQRQLEQQQQQSDSAMST